MNLIEVLKYLNEILKSEALVIHASRANTHVHAVAFIDTLIKQENGRLAAVEASAETVEVKADEV